MKRIPQGDTQAEHAIKAACRLALLAPSAHNSQPWHIKINAKQVTVSPSKSRWLHDGDPVGRQGWIGIGCYVENLTIAAASLKLRSKVTFRNKEIEVMFTAAKYVGVEQGLVQAIEDRFSDRSKYKNRQIEPEKLKQIASIELGADTALVVTEDRQVIQRVADLTSRAISMALANPSFRKELASLIVIPTSKRKTGIATKSLRVSGVRGLLEPKLINSGLGRNKQARRERELWESARALILVFTKGDTPEHWFEAGRVYQRAGLEATRLGLRQATSAGIVEALDFHTDVEKMLNTSMRLQTVMRIGYSDAEPAKSPRLSLEEVVAR